MARTWTEEQKLAHAKKLRKAWKKRKNEKKIAVVNGQLAAVPASTYAAHVEAHKQLASNMTFATYAAEQIYLHIPQGFKLGSYTVVPE